ncbi:MAG TPA: hypothetical protein DEO36_10925, partial [Flavobacteriaceae bacterium]|nr:hypothetical protein [Flavobacteriaceae bacterium]
GKGAIKLIDNDFSTEYRRQSTLAVPVQTLISDILMYPNPTHHILNIKSKYPIEKVEIFSLLGKKVFEKTDGTSLDLGKLISGVYFVKISSNNTLVSKKLVIK